MKDDSTKPDDYWDMEKIVSFCNYCGRRYTTPVAESYFRDNNKCNKCIEIEKDEKSRSCPQHHNSFWDR
mgnify:CR=1 FL=1